MQPPSKTAQVRDLVLSRIEDGTWPAGSSLPGARDLAEELGISFVKVQQGLETLARDGVLEIRPRSGTQVRAGWRERMLSENLSIFNMRGVLPWVEGLQGILAQELPGLRITDAFPRSILEIKNVLHVQQHHDEYLDLSEALAEALPQTGPLFDEALAPFRVGGRLVGIPLICSPRVAYFNPELLRRYGCPLPAPGWTWEQFLDGVRRLSGRIEPWRIFDWTTRPFAWLNIVMRAGGRLFADGDDPIAVDHPRTRAGLRRFCELGDALAWPAPYKQDSFDRAFAAGEVAYAFAPRQFAARLRSLGGTRWDAAPLPLIDGGDDVCSMAGDLACVRSTCTDPSVAAAYVRVMLSPAVQDHFGRLGYGVPVRKASCFASIDLSDRRDTLFLAEMARMRAEPTQPSADLMRLVIGGVSRLIDLRLDVDAATAEVAAAARLHLAVQRHQQA